MDVLRRRNRTEWSEAHAMTILPLSVFLSESEVFVSACTNFPQIKNLIVNPILTSASSDSGVRSLRSIICLR
jgi:hypothetical protein